MWAERRRQALELRKAGATYQQIAKQLKYAGKGNVCRDIERAIAEITTEPAEDVKKIELARLDALLVGIWTKASKGDPMLIDRVIRIMDRRAKYLGLDAPVKTRNEHSGPEGGPIQTEDGAKDELIARIDRLIAARRSDSTPDESDEGGGE